MAVRKRESKLFDRIKKNIKNVHFTRIESSTVNGIPDVHGTGSGNSFWLELKSNTDKFPTLDRFQISWCYEYQALLQSSLKLYRVTCVPNDFSKQDPVLTLPDPVPVARWHELRALLLHH
jgi:hypothetical protein